MSAYAPPYDNGGNGGFGGALLIAGFLCFLGLIPLGLAAQDKPKEESNNQAAEAKTYTKGQVIRIPNLGDVTLNPDDHPLKGHALAEVNRVRSCLENLGPERMISTKTQNRFVLLCREDPGKDEGWLVMVIQKINNVWTEVTSYAVDPAIAITELDIFRYFFTKDSTVLYVPPPWSLP